MRDGRLTEAKADIRLAYEIDPTDLYVCKQFGDILCAAKDYVGGLAKYDAAITADPLFLAPRLGKANLLMLTSAVDGIEEFRRAVKVFAQDHSALNEVAVLPPVEY